MKNTLRKSFNILKNNSLFIQPLLLFFLIILSIMIFLNGRTLLSYAKISLLVAFLLMFIAFCSGWFHIIKLGITTYNENDSKEEIIEKSINNFKKFIEGIGEKFLKLLGTYFFLFIIYSAIIFVAAKLCLHYFGLPEIIYDIKRIEAAASPAEKMNILNSIPIQNQISFMNWVLVLYPVSVILNFFAILTCAALYFDNSNIFKTIFSSVKFLFKNILFNMLIILILQFIYIVINLLSVVLGTNVIALFITTMLLVIYLNFYIILVFCFYNDKTNNNSDNGTELFGEDEAGC